MLSPPEHYYAVHFAEVNSPGYLLISPLGQGAFGTTMLVLSIADSKIYVRKIDDIPQTRTNLPIQATEVRNHIAHSNIPKLISYTEHDFIPPTTIIGSQVQTSTIWQFCNGGTLGQFLANFAWSSSRQDSIPEVFIYKFFEQMLSLLITIFLQGVTHRDLHDANVFLHWPSPDKALPEVFLGDFGLSSEYPWRDHPDPALNTPFQLRNFSEVTRPQFSHDPSRRNNNNNNNNNNNSQQPPRWDTRKLLQWYFSCRRDVVDVQNLIEGMILCIPSPSDSPHHPSLKTAARGNQGIAGYSARLVRHAHELGEQMRLPADAARSFRPFEAMQKLRHLHARVRDATRHAELEFHALSAHKQQNNVVRLSRPALPEARPATWSSAGAVARDGGGGAAFVTMGQDPQWQLELDRGTFRVRMVQHDGQRWRVVS